MTKCVICERRPVHDKGRCLQCSSTIKVAERRKQAQQPVKFLTYHGHVVGLYPNGGRTLKGRLLRRGPEHLPKLKTLDLNTYLHGFTREQIKAFKAAVLKLAHA